MNQKGCLPSPKLMDNNDPNQNKTTTNKGRLTNVSRSLH